ncbi:MAG: hypothetical protein AAB524_00505 [Patescibacteria group bacterium]
MFRHLTDFGYKRILKEAIGFYIAYLLISILFAALLGGILGVIIGEEKAAFETALKIGNIVAVVAVLILSFLILKAKNQLRNFLYIFLTVGAGVAALFGGGLFGLIFVAFFTTRKNASGTTA